MGGYPSQPEIYLHEGLQIGQFRTEFWPDADKVGTGEQEDVPCHFCLRPCFVMPALTCHLVRPLSRNVPALIGDQEGGDSRVALWKLGSMQRTLSEGLMHTKLHPVSPRPTS